MFSGHVPEKSDRISVLIDILPWCFQRVFFENRGKVTAVVEGQLHGYINHGVAFQEQGLSP